MIGCSSARNRLDAWDMMGSSVSRAGNRVESACTRNPLEQQTRHLPLDDQLHRLPGARPMQAPDAACFIRDASCEPSHSLLHPHATHRANSAAAVGAAGICLPACLSAPPTRPTRQSFSHSHTQAPLLSSIARVLQGLAHFRDGQSQPACTHAQDMEERPLTSPLTLDYVTSTGLAANPRHTNTHTHITSPSPHHVVDKHLTIIMQDCHWIWPATRAYLTSHNSKQTA